MAVPPLATPASRRYTFIVPKPVAHWLQDRRAVNNLGVGQHHDIAARFRNTPVERNAGVKRMILVGKPYDLYRKRITANLSWLRRAVIDNDDFNVEFRIELRVLIQVLS